MVLESWTQGITYAGPSNVIEELNSHVLWPSLLFSQNPLVWESETAFLRCVLARERGWAGMPQNIHHSLNWSVQNWTQTGARGKNLILSVKTAIIFQCLGKLLCKKGTGFMCVYVLPRQGFAQSLTDSLTQGHTDLRRNSWRFVTAWQIDFQPWSVLTFPPSALYSFSSPSKSLAKPKSVIFTWFGDFTRTFRAAKSRCTSLLSSRYIIPWRNKNSTIMLRSLTCYLRANFHCWHVKGLVQLGVFTMRKWPRGQKFSIGLALKRRQD